MLLIAILASLVNSFFTPLSYPGARPTLHAHFGIFGLFSGLYVQKKFRFGGAPLVYYFPNPEHFRNFSSTGLPLGGSIPRG